MESLTPAQQVVKIVHQVLSASWAARLTLIFRGLRLQSSLCTDWGSGKTTAAGKLALQLKKGGRKVLLVSCDVYRPAAQKQLEVVAEMAGVSFFTLSDKVSPEVIAKKGVEKAIESACNVVILDTAGRLQIDDEMMDEAQRINQASSPRERLLVVDAMTGQEACQVAQEFDRVVDITGVILTKLDSDARGGAALSIAKVTGKPIKFASLGEKLDDFQVFHPDRMASRILGMGDVLTLIEKAEAAFDQEKAAEMEEKLRRKQFTLEDFMEQMKEVKKMGSFGDLLRMIPGFARAQVDLDVDPKELARVEAIINSMTPEERQNPDIISGSRRRRIARGSGTTVQDVNRLLKQFYQARKMLFQMSGPDKRFGRLRFF